jgi:hypothetical protein
MAKLGLYVETRARMLIVSAEDADDACSGQLPQCRQDRVRAGFLENMSKSSFVGRRIVLLTLRMQAKSTKVASFLLPDLTVFEG